MHGSGGGLHGRRRRRVGERSADMSDDMADYGSGQLWTVDSCGQLWTADVWKSTCLTVPDSSHDVL